MWWRMCMTYVNDVSCYSWMSCRQRSPVCADLCWKSVPRHATTTRNIRSEETFVPELKSVWFVTRVRHDVGFSRAKGRISTFSGKSGDLDKPAKLKLGRKRGSVKNSVGFVFVGENFCFPVAVINPLLFLFSLLWCKKNCLKKLRGDFSGAQRISSVLESRIPVREGNAVMM